MLHLFAGLDLHTGLLLLLCTGFRAVLHEAINGFRCRSQRRGNRYLYPRDAFSARRGYGGGVQLLGVLLGGLECCLLAIVHMLPTDLPLCMGSSHGLAMVFSMLLAAIIWNLGTWYFGLPASSSHTLIGDHRIGLT